MLNVICWKWGTKFTAQHINWLRDQLLWGMRGESFRLICVTDDARGIECETFPLWNDYADVPAPHGPHGASCFRRLKLFKPGQLREMGIADGEWVVSIDVDVLVMGDIRPIMFKEGADFLGLKVKGARHPIVYNGTLWKFRAGTLATLWEGFNPAASPKLHKNAGYFGSDQAHFSYCLIRGQGMSAGWDESDGIYAYRSLRGQGSMPANARLINFCGRWNPWDADVQKHSAWVLNFWPPRNSGLAISENRG